uniref:PPM-type phosphatase domain-containing protein n=1 Tax=Polytomella parva TaxID=51329 RepID=A0A7S0YI47_9CHLO|mmetsp:Transcript_21620/g.38632  ORF Transcript_21620/g.38632 Transcript_21620/m.38632 type:complete len:439 (+) Transcript_21620:97-1413(+)
MGCSSSVPSHGVDENEQKDQKKMTTPAVEQKVEANAAAVPSQEKDEDEKNKTKSTRARRLSYITNQTQQNPSAAPQAAELIQSPENDTAGASKSANTRARRLSYITNNDGGNPVGMEIPVGAEGDDGGQDVGSVAQHGPQAQDEDQEKRTVRVNVACMSRAGREPGYKKTNQDNCFAFEKYITEDQSLFGAMDGHGPHGHLVSGYVKQHLPIILVNYLTLGKDVPKALASGFMEVDSSLGSSRIDCEFSGSTCVVAYLKGKTLTTAWVGDSRGVMGRETRKGWEAIDLTTDHKPTTPEEKNRILKSSGRVERLIDEMGQPMGPYRVWLQYAWIPGLAMSRALGDVLAHQVGVISQPDHTVVDLTPQDKFIVLASDGVWEFISSKEAVDIVARFDNAEEACRQLVDEAYSRWLTEEEGVVDDITAVVVRFIHPNEGGMA